MIQKYVYCSALLIALCFASAALPASAHPSTQNVQHAKQQPLPSESLLILENTTYNFPSHPTLAQASSAVAPMSEGFESLWPGAGWQLNNGPYTWGRRSCHPHSGQFAGWSVGGGAAGNGLACSGAYPQDANVWAMYGPFDLSNATSAQLRFFMWGKTQITSGCLNDKFVALSSVDGINFSGLTGCGDFRNGSDGNGYSLTTLDLTRRLGQPQVWILFGLLADSTINDIGITIDDISLDVTTSAPPTSTHTATPTNTPLPTTSPTATPTNTPLPTPIPSGTPTSVATPNPAPPLFHVYLPLILGPYILPPSLTPIISITPQPPAPPTTTPLPGTPNYDGSWSGATIQGAPISFTVANRALTVLAYEYTIQGCGMGVRTEFGIPKALTGNTFTMQSTLHKILPLPPFTPYTVDVTVQGTVNTATSATGTLQVNDALCGTLNTTWTATKL